MTLATVPPPEPGDRLLNRELSWLDFNERVLELPADPGIPLLERVKFGAFFAANLDEFFAVRVAGLMDQAESGVAVRSADGRTPHSVLGDIRARVVELTRRHARLWTKELCPELKDAGIRVGGTGDCSDEELAELRERFEREVFPVLTPLAVGPGQPFPYISPLSLSLGVFVRDPDSGEERLARVKVPEGLPRFVAIGRRGLLLPLEDVIAHFLPALFPSMELAEQAVFRVTRDADFELSDEADDLLEAVELELRRRRFGDVVRLEVSDSVSPAMLERLKRGLGAADDQVYAIPGLLDLSETMQLTQLERPDLKDEPWIATTNTRFASLPDGDLFAEIRKGDVLVHQPYESFASSFSEFVRAAARDRDVVGVKTTVYRTSDESPLVPALIEAVQDGKQSVCLVELKARFDERRNIEWSRALERAGVHVVYGFPNLKIHMKATLVVRREGGALRRYAHVGTGNYHSITARTYEDFGLFTADEEITADIADLFNYVTGFGKPQKFRCLLVAPFTLRDGLIDHIRRVAEAAKAGKPARIRIKVNSLTDPLVIEELYGASDAGARIELLTRSICSLRPGVKGLSENVAVRSVLGRFFEHSRTFTFEIKGKSECYLGSADLMPRNLDNRLEILVPVTDLRNQQKLISAFDTLMADPASWRLGPDGRWKRGEPRKGERGLSGQPLLMRNAKRRLARRLAS
jgi:polyphosphate kinase